jgi:hypothetical protein
MWCPCDNASVPVPDAWPPDLHRNRRINTTDVLQLKPVFMQAVPPASPRYDLFPNNVINTTDVLSLKPTFTKECFAYPPLTYPPVSLSYYIDDDFVGAWYYKAFAEGQQSHTNKLNILMFGPNWNVDGEHGVRIYNGEELNTDEIRGIVEQWMIGYWDGTTGTSKHATIAVGLTTEADIDPGHGTAWAQMIDELNDWIYQHGYQSRLAVVGGIDLEFHFTNYAQVTNWIDEYNAELGGWMLINFGSLDGCPPPSWYACTPDGEHENDWNKDRALEVAYGSPYLFPVPQNYAETGFHAGQWVILSEYSKAQLGYPINFIGSLTQWRICTLNPSLSGCSGNVQEPLIAWGLLNRLPNGHAEVYDTTIGWATDWRRVSTE